MESSDSNGLASSPADAATAAAGDAAGAAGDGDGGGSCAVVWELVLGEVGWSVLDGCDARSWLLLLLLGDGCMAVGCGERCVCSC